MSSGSDIPISPTKKFSRQTRNGAKIAGWILAIFFLLFMVGICWIYSMLSGAGEIASYQAIKYEVLNPPSHRMVGAIVTRAPDAWFFKAVGKREQLTDELSSQIQEFVKQVTFDEATNNPVWQKPQDWQSSGATQMRYETLSIPADEGNVELSISKLPFVSGDSDDFKLKNINRWRGQLELNLLERDELAQQATQIPLGEGEATWIDYQGRFKSSMPPMVTSSRPPPPANKPPAAANRQLDYKIPEGWSEVAASGMRKASFTITADGQSALVTVIDLTAQAGDLIPNIVRWRGQVGLPEVSDQEILDAVEEVDLDGKKGSFVSLLGPQQGILGVIAIRRQKSWYIKLNGPTDLAKAEEQRFREFVKSIKFK